MRTPFIAGNWKRNCTISEALNLVNSLAAAETVHAGDVNWEVLVPQGGQWQ